MQAGDILDVMETSMMKQIEATAEMINNYLYVAEDLRNLSSDGVESLRKTIVSVLDKKTIVSE